MKGSTGKAFMTAAAGLGLAILFCGAAVMSGLGNRWGLWGFGTGISVLKWAAYGEITALVLSLIGGIAGLSAGTGTARRMSCAGMLIAVGVLAMPLSIWVTAHRLPLIHDISTDTDNPPRFEKILPLRQGSPNTAEYGGPEVAKQQHRAYPDIQPLLLRIPAGRAFELALAAAQKMGWKIENTDPAGMIIEATDTTFWFGFRDDIIIRITPRDGGSRVDIRSVSRVGRSDIGANAGRIRSFLKKLEAALPRPE